MALQTFLLYIHFVTAESHFRNKSLMLDEMTKINASRFAISQEYKCTSTYTLIINTYSQNASFGAFR